MSIVCLLNHIYPPFGYPILSFGPIFYSSPVHSYPLHTIHVYSRKVSMDHTLYLYDVN